MECANCQFAYIVLQPQSQDQGKELSSFLNTLAYDDSLTIVEGIADVFGIHDKVTELIESQTPKLCQLCLERLDKCHKLRSELLTRSSDTGGLISCLQEQECRIVTFEQNCVNCHFKTNDLKSVTHDKLTLPNGCVVIMAAIADMFGLADKLKDLVEMKIQHLKFCKECVEMLGEAYQLWIQLEAYHFISMIGTIRHTYVSQFEGLSDPDSQIQTFLNKKTCPKCPRKFNSRRRLLVHVQKDHIGIPSDKTKFRCFMCRKKTSWKHSELMNHMSAHESRKYYLCLEPSCSYSSTILVSATKHVLRTGWDPPVKRGKCWKQMFRCFKCDERCNSQAGLLTHLIMDHVSQRRNIQKSSQICCPFCKDWYQGRHGLEVHFLEHTKESAFKCPHVGCTFVAASGSDLERHASSNHEVPPKSVVMATLKPNNATLLLNHFSHQGVSEAPGASEQTESPLSTTEKKSTFSCEYASCSKTFSYQAYLFLHMQRKHTSSEKSADGKRITCYICQKHEFCNKIAHHMFTHSKEKRFQCPIEGCNFWGISVRNVLSHNCEAARSSNGAELTCPVSNCTFVTLEFQDWKKHLQTHDNIYRCKSETSHRKQLNRNYKCTEPNCLFATHAKTYLMKHLLSHTRNQNRSRQAPSTLFSCPFPGCEFSTKSPFIYKRHKLRNHSQPVEIKYEENETPSPEFETVDSPEIEVLDAIKIEGYSEESPYDMDMDM